MMAMTLEAIKNGGHADVGQTRDCAGRIVGMERTENQVSSQRCLYSDLGRLTIADFSNQDYVRCLTQHRPDDPRKSSPILCFTSTWLMPGR